MMQRQLNAANSFYETARKRPDAAAIAVGETVHTYGDLAAVLPKYAALLQRHRRTGRIGILATRSMEAYLGILATLWAGGTYVPLNQKWPEARLIELMGMLELDALIVDRHGAALLTPSLRKHAPHVLIVPDETLAQPGDMTINALPADELDSPVAVTAEHPAYVIFTSGTTGTPKGVVISSASLQHYLDQTEPWTRFTEYDRIGECCDVTFDLSVHNMFLAWRAGSSLHLMSSLDLMAPARFVRSHAVTVWLSVPTIAATMRRLGSLQPGIFPSLRLSIFCGEPLPVAVAQAWADATPNGVVENIYGPTECTVICLRQPLTTPPVETAGRGTLSIGLPYTTTSVAILDDKQQPVSQGEPGEIALSGPQVGIGYFNSPEQTADRFRTIDGQRWYLTGDLGRQDETGGFHHLGRIDNQVKVKGNRIELEEIDAHLRRAAGTDTVATIAWPIKFGSAEGLVAFCSGSALDGRDIRQAMRRSLPEYMVPTDIRVMESLPLNINGKVDRKALREQLDSAQSAAQSIDAA